MSDFVYRTDPWHDETGRLYVRKVAKKIAWPFGLKQQYSTIYVAADDSFVIGKVKQGNGKAFWALQTRHLPSELNDDIIPELRIYFKHGPRTLNANVFFGDLTARTDEEIDSFIRNQLDDNGYSWTYTSYDERVWDGVFLSVTPDGKYIVPSVPCVTNGGWKRLDPSTWTSLSKRMHFGFNPGNQFPYMELCAGSYNTPDGSRAEMEADMKENYDRWTHAAQSAFDETNLRILHGGTPCGTLVVKIPVSALYRPFEQSVQLKEGSFFTVSTEPESTHRRHSNQVFLLADDTAGPWGEYVGFGVVNKTTHNISTYISGTVTATSSSGYKKNSKLARLMDELYLRLFNLNALSTLFCPKWGYTDTVIDCLLVNSRRFIEDVNSASGYSFLTEDKKTVTPDMLKAVYLAETGCDITTDTHACLQRDNETKLSALIHAFDIIKYKEIFTSVPIEFKSKEVSISISCLRTFTTDLVAVKSTPFPSVLFDKAIAAINSGDETRLESSYLSVDLYDGDTTVGARAFIVGDPVHNTVITNGGESIQLKPTNSRGFYWGFIESNAYINSFRFSNSVSEGENESYFPWLSLLSVNYTGYSQLDIVGGIPLPTCPNTKLYIGYTSDSEDKELSVDTGLSCVTPKMSLLPPASKAKTTVDRNKQYDFTVSLEKLFYEVGKN